MKRYSFIVTLHILSLCLLSVGIWLLAVRQLWFSALMVLLVLVGVAIHLYHMQMVQIRMMRQLAESLRFDDMTLSFRSPYRNRSMEQMVDELSEAMQGFRTRVLEHNEMQAWQKLKIRFVISLPFISWPASRNKGIAIDVKLLTPETVCWIRMWSGSPSNPHRYTADTNAVAAMAKATGTPSSIKRISTPTNIAISILHSPPPGTGWNCQAEIPTYLPFESLLRQ